MYALHVCFSEIGKCDAWLYSKENRWHVLENGVNNTYNGQRIAECDVNEQNISGGIPQCLLNINEMMRKEMITADPIKAKQAWSTSPERYRGKTMEEKE